MATETITYRSTLDALPSEFDVKVTIETTSARAVDDILHGMDGGTPLVRALDRWFSKEVGMERVK